MRKIINQLIPFILLGTSLVAFAIGIMLFAYLLLFGAIVGGILYMISWLRDSYFKNKRAVQQSKRNRIIDSPDWRRK